ncbi:MAG TPA: hypothetical protein VHD38_02925 [Candidatus Paceibacterota bacterium]|jgi:hypothetical protein|nr:hypothetical protein [Candidatus Paceibacterota bacterium]
MIFKRYFYTVVLALLLSVVILQLVAPEVIPIVANEMKVGLTLLGLVAFGTVGGIWSVGAVVGWTTGKTPLTGIGAILTRLGIALVADLLFSVTTSIVASGFGVSAGVLEIFFGTGLFVVVPAVWIAAQLVDMLVRQYSGDTAPRRR